MIEFDTHANGAVPFWFWNGDQQEDEITRQLKLAAEGGLKGMAIHARRGNRTDYMSERWIALTRHTCEEARRLGLDIWLYDEEGFPSGTVGHRLEKNNPFYQQKLLSFAYLRGSQLGELRNLVAVYDTANFERIDPGAVSPEHEVLAFRMSYLPRYVDALKRETVERFMEMTHHVYFDELREYFGSPITHIYTDDLNSYLDRGASLPWTEKLPEIFTERLGYSLLDKLPALIENVSGCEKVRLDFRSLVLDLFLSAFVEPMYRWCDEHGVIFTGHLSGDEGETTKSVQRFGSAMAFYEYEHIPGIDDFLCSVSSGCYLDQLRNDQNHCPAILFKQASSVANQLKGGACSCEVLTFLGWGAPLWGQSALLNYELALGVNLMVHHAFSYATGSVAKRDCPPSYFFQQPYWPQYRRFHDAMARSTQLLTRGTYDANTLIVHPMSSCWIAMDGRRCSIGYPFEIRTEQALPAPETLEDSLAAVSHELLKLHIGFEYGDEWLLAKHGKAQDAQLQVGAMSYSTVIIPGASNLLETTVALLEVFQVTGGQLLTLKPTTDCRVDGEQPTRAVFGDRLTPLVLQSPADLRKHQLTPSLDVQVEEFNAPVVCHTRTVDGRKEHFLTNVSDRSQSIRWNGALHAYDPVENVGIQRTQPDGGWLVLPPFHAIHLLPELPVGVTVKPVKETLFAPAPTGKTIGLSATHWRIIPEQPNLMLVDWCDLPNGRAVCHGESIDSEVTELAVTVDIPDPRRITAIVGETVTLETMWINDKPLPAARRQHPSSQDLLVADVAGLLQRGANRFTFQRLAGDVLFEPFYLMGNFAVHLVETDAGMRPKLAAPHIAFGDLVESGLPFYWGGVRHEIEISAESGAAWLDCGDVDGVIVLTINGSEVGCRYAAPYRFWIADHLVEGPNEIVLTLYNTAQNLFGPHRRDYGVALHPCQRRGTGNHDYYLAGFGIHGPVALLSR